MILPNNYYCDAGLYIIYALLDPVTYTVIYIGKSCSGFRRVRQHFAPSQLKARTKKINWIKNLLKQGIYPSVCVLQQAQNKHELPLLEKHFIAEYRRNGVVLLNMTDSGDGECYIKVENYTVWNKGKKEKRSGTIQRMRNAKLGISTRPRTQCEKRKIQTSNIKAHKNKCKPFQCIQNNKIYNSQGEAANELGLNPANISGVLNKHKKTTGGYSFVFIDQESIKGV